MRGTHGLCAAIIVWLLGASAALAQDARDVFRIGLGGIESGCSAADDPSLDGPIAGYARHLEIRLGVAVEICGMAPEQAADALSAGTVDFVTLATHLTGDVADTVRPILRVRPKGEMARTEFVLVGAKDAPIMASNVPETGDVLFVAMNQGEADALAQIVGQGAPVTVPISKFVDPTLTAALESRADDSLIAVNVGRFLIFCQENASECEDTKVLWRGFAPLDTAWTVRADMGKERMYRLIGIHTALHFEEPEIFQAIASTDALEFEPTEPWAFSFRNTVQ